MKKQAGLLKNGVILQVILSLLLIFSIACGISPKEEPPQQNVDIILPTPTMTIVILPTEAPAAPTEAAATEAEYAASETLPLPILSLPPFLQMVAIDMYTGWGMAKEALAITVDQGVTWYNATPPGISDLSTASASFSDDYFWNDYAAWLLIPSADHTSAVLHRTLSAGVTWDSAVFPYADAEITFLDRENGTAMAALGAGAGSMAVAVLNTTDSGATWTEVFHNDPSRIGAGDSLPLGGIKNGMAFCDMDHGWITGSRPEDGYVYLYRSVDGGTTWEHRDLPLPVGLETSMILVDPPAFSDASYGILPVHFLTGTGKQTVFYQTRNCGESWEVTTSISNVQNYGFYLGITGWVWDGSGLYRTTDSAETWALLSPGFSSTPDSVQFDFIDEQHGWALLRDGDDTTPDVLMSTTDGGQNWTALAP